MSKAPHNPLYAAEASSGKYIQERVSEAEDRKRLISLETLLRRQETVEIFFAHWDAILRGKNAPEIMFDSCFADCASNFLASAVPTLDKEERGQISVLINLWRAAIKEEVEEDLKEESPQLEKLTPLERERKKTRLTREFLTRDRLMLEGSKEEIKERLTYCTSTS